MQAAAPKAESGFNTDAAPNNTLHWALSQIAVPFASLCITLKLKPFVITTISNALVIVSLFVLWRLDAPLIFSALWALALVLDFADGIVARRTATSSANGSFYDHFSDKVKVALLFLVVGLRYETIEIWIVSTFAANLFLLMSVANEGLAHRFYRLDQGLKAKHISAKTVSDLMGDLEQEKPTMARRIKFFMSSLLPKNQVLAGLYYSLTMVQGNSMLLLVPVAFNREAAFWAAAWFAWLCFKSLFFIVRAQITINGRLAAARISWK